jgi:hypothetical protein
VNPRSQNRGFCQSPPPGGRYRSSRAAGVGGSCQSPPPGGRYRSSRAAGVGGFFKSPLEDFAFSIGALHRDQLLLIAA